MKKWLIREPVGKEDAEKLGNLPDLVRYLLFYRGIKTQDEAEKFLNPDYEAHLHDPFDMLGMNKAVDRILQAIKNDERIIIYGDYDADGVCSSVIICEFLKKIGFENYHIHIPDRHKDGYGLTLEVIDEFIEQNTKLLVTFDCGITDVEEVAKANSNGIDVIITDHHLVQGKVPNAFAIVDAKQKDDRYPFDMLCGAGVSFKLVQALVDKAGKDLKIAPGWEKWLLDLVAIATIADMVPLVDENRTLTYFGLKVLKRYRRQGISAFLKKLKINPAHINEGDIGFMIAPRVNIASRMEHANTSFELLSTESEEEANWIVGRLEELNNSRKKIVENILKEVFLKFDKEKPEIVFIGNQNWHPGVLGIAANRLIDKYNCPVFLWGKGESVDFKGSCRALAESGLNLVDLMNEIPDGILIGAGGHALAGGFTIREGQIENLEKGLIEAYRKAPKNETGEVVLNIDKRLSIDDINWSIYSMVEKLEPFGVENPAPVFLFSNIEIDNIKKFGNGGIHLQLDFKKSDNKIVPAIGFFIANEEKFNLQKGDKIDLVASIEKSTFRNIPELRLRIVDLRRVNL